MVKQVGKRAVTKGARTRRAAPPDDRGTETRILDAAHAVFLRRGTAGARMQEIAHEAGVNPALLHYYFRSKERLSAAVFQRAAAQLLPAVVRALASQEPLEHKVREVIDVELRQLLATPYLPGYILSELAHRPERVRELVSTLVGKLPEELGRNILGTLRTQINAAVRAGDVRPIAPEEFVVNLLSLCIFPFAARPLWSVMLGWDDEGFQRFMARRRRDLPVFFLKAIRP
jgi:AcrR family transcriptional regulator